MKQLHSPRILDPLRHATRIEALLEGVRQEERISDRTLHLTANENRLSKLAQSFLGSSLSSRQVEGTLDEHDGADVISHGSFLLRGMPGVFALEGEARDAAQDMFNAALSDFRPLSGLHAMICTLSVATEPGDLVFSFDPSNGGHSATRHLLRRLGRRSKYLPWSDEGVTIDLDALAALLDAEPAQAIYFDLGTPLYELPLQHIRKIAGNRTMMVYDGSHTLGLIAGGIFQSPLQEGCDILQGNTHKTFPGPQKGIINFRDKQQGLSLSQSITSGFISNHHAHDSIAAYITTLEMKAFGEDYARQMVTNAQYLAEIFRDLGLAPLRRRDLPTQSHQILLRLEDADNMCRRLFASGISTNARSCFGGRVIRIGTQEVTRRGMAQPEMLQIAQFFKRALLDGESVNSVKKDVVAFNAAFKHVEYSFDRAPGLFPE